MEDIEEDKIANQVLEGLPPSFMVFGTRKDLDPLEEFWMNKLTNIERQYDQHVVDLERKVLNERAQKRSIRKQTGKILKLKEEVAEQFTEVERLKVQTGSLNAQLKDKEYEAKSLSEKLERTSAATKHVARRMEDERQTRMQFEKECSDLRNKLRFLEKEKAQLLVDLDIKENEKVRVEERESILQREKWMFVRNISDVDSECRIQTDANIKLCEDMEKLMGIEKSLEVGLLRERQAMGEMMEEMKSQRQKHQTALRQLDKAVKDKRDLEESLMYSAKEAKELNRSVRHWKDELEFKEHDNLSQSQEIRDLKRRNSNIRCILADTKHKLTACLSELKSLENEKRRAEVELESAKRHEKSLQLEIKKNELRKFKLAEKILKAHPFLLQRADSQRGSSAAASGGGRACAKNEIESYKKSIWKLERQRDEVERKIRELQRKENVYRLKLDKYAGMEKQIFWTGKAMAKLEGDRSRLEQLLKTMESNMPMKVPFKKLVTDPSVLDRLAKNKVLQKRLFQQAEKIEELKFSARKILQFREEQFGAMEQRHDDIPTWKLSYWRNGPMTPENLLSGMSLDVLKRVPYHADPSKPFTDENYYKNYMQHLDQEIPKLKREIDHLERKRFFIAAEKAEVDEGSTKVKATSSSELVKLKSLMLPEDQAQEPTPGNSEQGGSGNCTPELSMHGSSFAADTTKKVIPGKSLDKETPSEKKAPKIQKQAARAQSSSTEDEGGNDDDDEDGRGGESSDAASEIPSDKS